MIRKINKPRIIRTNQKPKTDGSKGCGCGGKKQKP